MSENLIFETRKPISKKLQKYIAYYYFHSKDSGEPIRFIYHPHIRKALTIYKNSRIEFDGIKSTTIPDNSVKYFSAYANMECQSRHVEIQTPFKKIGIAFEPLGIHNFVEGPLSLHIKGDKDLHFRYFENSMEEVLNAVHLEKNLDSRVELLDEYFLQKYNGFENSVLERAIFLLTSSDKKYFVRELAEEIGVTRKTLLRHFKNHLSVSVKDYIDIVQFRKAIDTYKTFKEKPALSRVAYSNDYYDQSEFIKHFKKITNYNPKKFFNSIVTFGDEDTYWTLV